MGLRGSPGFFERYKNAMKILALETSTTSAKAMLYDTLTNAFDTVTHPYTDECLRSAGTDQSGREGNPAMTAAASGLDAEACFRKMCAAGKEVLARADAKRHDGKCSAQEVEMIALVGVWHSIFACDRSCKPITPVFHWNHTGAARICSRIREDSKAADRYYHTSGCMVNAIYPFFKIRMMQEMGYPVQDCFLLSQGAYNNLRMTGQMITTRCNASGDGLLDIHKKEYYMDGLREFGVREWQLPGLTDSEKAHPLTEEAAHLLGLESGIPVLPSNADGGSNQIGAGAAREGIMTFSVGTSSAIRLSVREVLIPERPSTWCYLSPKGYLSGAATNGGCICTDWAKRSLFPAGTGYEQIEAQIKARTEAQTEAQIRGGATTPVFLPFLTGERCPGWNDERSGGFSNVKEYHTAVDLYLAVMEGVLFNLYQCYKELVRLNPVPEKIMLSGGILRSHAWTQMCADIFGRDMTITDVEQGSLLGGIVMGMEAAGIISDVKEYRPRILATVRCRQEQHRRYKENYERYLQAYACS